MTNVDPLDLAFLAIGVDAAFRETTHNYEGGELELVQEVMGFLPLLDAHYQAFFVPDGFPGCWAYEVAEAFGTWCAHELMAGNTVDKDIVFRWLDENATGNNTRSGQRVAGATPAMLGAVA